MYNNYQRMPYGQPPPYGRPQFGGGGPPPPGPYPPSFPPPFPDRERAAADRERADRDRAEKERLEKEKEAQSVSFDFPILVSKQHDIGRPVQVAWSCHGDRLATVSDKGLQIWDPSSTSDPMERFNKPTLDGGRCSLVTWHPTRPDSLAGTLDASSPSRYHLQFWDRLAAKPATDLKLESRCFQASYSSDGLYFATHTLHHLDDRVSIYDSRTNRPLHMHDFAFPISSMVFAPNGQQLYLGTETGVMETYALPSFQLLQKYQAHDRVRGMAMDRTGHRLVTAGDDAMVSVWNVEHMTMEHSFSRALFPLCNGKCLGLASGGGHVAFVTDDGVLPTVSVPNPNAIIQSAPMDDLPMYQRMSVPELRNKWLRDSLGTLHAQGVRGAQLWIYKLGENEQSFVKLVNPSHISEAPFYAHEISSVAWSPTEPRLAFTMRTCPMMQSTRAMIGLIAAG